MKGRTHHRKSSRQRRDQMQHFIGSEINMDHINQALSRFLIKLDA